MSLSIRARPLTHEEQKYFRNSDLGRQSVSLGAMSIMGPADHPYIDKINIEIKRYKVDLGDGQYIYDGPSIPSAKGGKTIPVVWGAESAYTYLLAEASKLDIPVFYTLTYPQYHNPLYFQTIYADAFLESFSYADRTLGERYNNRTFLARWFGGMPKQSSKEARSINEEVRRILARSMK